MIIVGEQLVAVIMNNYIYENSFSIEKIIRKLVTHSSVVKYVS